MYLSKPERKAIMNSYACDGLIEDGHYQVEPDIWVYLFRDVDNKKYVLIMADYLDIDFDYFPQLLRFANSEFRQLDFVLQRKIPLKNNNSQDLASRGLLFEYTS